MRNEYEIGDLVRLSVSGRISLCKNIDDGSLGIVSGTPDTVPKLALQCVKVKWMVGYHYVPWQESTMHIDYIELVDERTKNVRSDT